MSVLAIGLIPLVRAPGDCRLAGAVFILCSLLYRLSGECQGVNAKIPKSAGNPQAYGSIPPRVIRATSSGSPVTSAPSTSAAKRG